MERDWNYDDSCFKLVPLLQGPVGREVIRNFPDLVVNFLLCHI